MKKTSYIILIVIFLNLSLLWIGCNFQAKTTFPDTQEGQLKITSIKLYDVNGNIVTSMKRANTVSISVITENCENCTYTFSEKEDRGEFTDKVWEAPYERGNYYLYVNATDGENVSNAVSLIKIENTKPIIESILYDSVSPGTNVITVRVRDNETTPHTILDLYGKSDLGNIVPAHTQTTIDEIETFKDIIFIWAPGTCSPGVTVTITIEVVDDNPDTATETIQFYYSS